MNCPATTDGSWEELLNFAFPQIATGDLDVGVVRQLPSRNLPLGYEFEPGPMKVVGFKAACWCRGLWEQNLEYPFGNSHIALIVADPDTA